MSLINLSIIDNFSSEIFWECCESNLGLLGEKQVGYLCAMQPQHVNALFDGTDEIDLVSLDKTYFEMLQSHQAIIRDQQCHLQLTEPHS